MNNKEDMMLVDGLKAQLILARIKETKEISDEDVLFFKFNYRSFNVEGYGISGKI